jgi:hypothetical protein
MRLGTGLSISSAQLPKVRRRSEIVTCFRLNGCGVAPRNVAIAAEIPVALAFNGLSHVVMMSTPSDLTDFAIGFSISEGILADADEILDLCVQEGETGIRVNMTISPERFAGLQGRRRNMIGMTGCGLCGVDDLTQVARPLPRVGTGVNVDTAAIHRALDARRSARPQKPRGRDAVGAARRARALDRASEPHAASRPGRLPSAWSRAVRERPSAQWPLPAPKRQLHAGRATARCRACAHFAKCRNPARSESARSCGFQSSPLFFELVLAAA